MRSSAPGALAGGMGRTTRLVLTPDRSGEGQGPFAGSGLARRHFRAAELRRGFGELRPRSAMQILDSASGLLAERFAPLFAVGFLLWLPALFVEAVLMRGGIGIGYFVGTPLMGIFVHVFAGGYTCALIGGVVRGRFASPREALWETVVRTPGLLLVAVGTGLGAIVLFCVFPVVLWIFAVVPAVYMIERRGLLASVNRGMRLVATGPAFLRWLGFRVIAFLMMLPFTGIQDVLTEPVPRAELRELIGFGGLPLEITLALLGAPFLAVATAFSAVIDVVFYFDLRVRREGYDLERRLDELDGGAEGEAA